MKRILVLAGLALSLAGCSFAPSDKVLEALANDHNAICWHVVLTTPWGTETQDFDRNHGCGSQAVPAIPAQVK